MHVLQSSGIFPADIIQSHVLSMRHWSGLTLKISQTFCLEFWSDETLLATRWSLFNGGYFFWTWNHQPRTDVETPTELKPFGPRRVQHVRGAWSIFMVSSQYPYQISFCNLFYLDFISHPHDKLESQRLSDTLRIDSGHQTASTLWVTPFSVAIPLFQ